MFFGCGYGRTVLACCFCGDRVVVAPVLFCSGVILGCGWVVVSISVLSVVVGGPVVVGEVVGVLSFLVGACSVAARLLHL